jgi:hypothetical protein
MKQFKSAEVALISFMKRIAMIVSAIHVSRSMKRLKQQLQQEVAMGRD